MEVIGQVPVNDIVQLILEIILIGPQMIAKSLMMMDEHTQIDSPLHG